MTKPAMKAMANAATFHLPMKPVLLPAAYCRLLVSRRRLEPRGLHADAPIYVSGRQVWHRCLTLLGLLGALHLVNPLCWAAPPLGPATLLAPAADPTTTRATNVSTDVSPDAYAALPPSLAGPFLAALQRAGVPLSSVSLYLKKLGAATPTLALHADHAMNPASTMKLLTTYAGLQLLGPDYRWRTAIYTDGQLTDGVLTGNVYVRGGGDPKLVPEDLQAMLTTLRDAGIETLAGDLVLDKSFFSHNLDSGQTIDGETTRAYNVAPDALLYAFKTLRFLFIPDPTGQAIQVEALPPLAQLAIDNHLQTGHQACPGSGGPQPIWQQQADGNLLARFSGRYPAACGEQETAIALLSHNEFFWGGFIASWQAVGGKFARLPALREAVVPPGARLLALHDSPTLAELIVDINKFSNNVMARQLYLTLGAEQSHAPATVEQSTRAIHRWLAGQGLTMPELVLENGAGLSREERISTLHLGQLLEHAQIAPATRQASLPALSDGLLLQQSLPIIGVDGTMRKRLINQSVAGNGWIKTGSLDDVRAIAGYVRNAAGEVYVVVSFINDSQAGAARAAHDVLLQWIYDNSATLAPSPASHPWMRTLPEPATHAP